ncbi:4-hydroxybenzoate octaprenyltransferase [Candidatus Profftia tarda]|nr:4-hydroxybenzoate octaprenyltransferase [Candidatus Profftia tarda]
MTQTKWRAYYSLMRIDKPIGCLLLLWPTYWALWLASGRQPPSILIFTIFTVGVFFMRAAGCVLNDFADRRLDLHVKRTAQRPLPGGLVTEKESKILFIMLILISFGIVLMLNAMTIFLSLVALVLVLVYPFMKRITHLPQVVLGIAFSWSIPMVYAAVTKSLPLSCWVLYLANTCWTIAYDTEYAMVDKNDDLKIGIKSTAILFGRFDTLILGLLQLATLLFMLLIGHLNNLNIAYYCGIIIAGLLFIYQHKLVSHRNPMMCFRAFSNNSYVGLVLFIGIVVSILF